MQDYDLTDEERAFLSGEVADTRPAAGHDDLLVEAPTSAPAPAASTPIFPAATSSASESQIAADVHGEAIQSALVDIWRDFALRWSAVLTKRLRVDTQIDVCRIVQPSYGEFVFGLDSPTCLQVAQSNQSEFPVLIELHPNILFPLLDRLLGGGAIPTTIVRRPLTVIEKRLAVHVSQPLLTEISAAWRHIQPFTLTLEQTESNPKVVRVAHPGDPMVVTEMIVRMGNVSGPLRIAMTWVHIERLHARILDPSLRAQSFTNDKSRKRNISVLLADSTLQRSELMDLRVGDIVTTESSPDDPAVLLLDGEPAYSVSVGAHGGKKAVRLLETRTSTHH